MQLKGATPSIDELKTIVERHLCNELDIMEMVCKLDKSHLEQFSGWYINHPYRRGIEEIKKIVRKEGSDREHKKISS